MPIPHALPLPGFDRVVVVISGFGDGFRRAIVHAVDVMGGTYDPVMWFSQPLGNKLLHAHIQI